MSLLQEAFPLSSRGETASPLLGTSLAISNTSKTWLIAGDSLLVKAKEIFHDTQVMITSQGRPHLGVPLGSQEFIDQFITAKINLWKEELTLLVDVAKTQPHAAFIHGYVHRFSYLCRTVPNAELSLQPLEYCICSQLIPTLTGQNPPNDSVRGLLGLLARLGGLGLVNPTKSSSTQHQASISIAAPLKDRILVQNHEYSLDCIQARVDAKLAAQKLQCDRAKDAASILKDTISCSLQCAMDLAQEKGASS